VVLPVGGLDTIAQSGSTRTTALSFQTPVRFGSFNWANSVQVTDATTTGRDSVRFRVDDPSTPDPTDSVLVSRTFPGRFESTLDWDTGINLPVLFRGSWKLQPVVGIANVAAGQPFALRNRNTNGDWVRQASGSASGSALADAVRVLPRHRPLSRIRHSVSPVITYNYEPAADVPEEFARAIAPLGQELQLRSSARQLLSVSLSQTFEGKRRPPSGDTTAANASKLRILSLSTSQVTYDFEQAKEPGRTGWVTDAVTNTLLSDLLPGFSLNLTHDLWVGQVGTDTADFDPFLQSVSANFSVSGNTFRSIASVFGLASTKPTDRREDFVPPSYRAESGRRRPGSFYSTSQAPLRSTGRAFSASFNYSLSRRRPEPGVEVSDDQSLGFSTSFSPTPFWALSWSTQYNITDNEFESHVVRLERDLHEWRAGFNFVKNANGNFAFYFSIYLTDLPDLKFDYDQINVRGMIIHVWDNHCAGGQQAGLQAKAHHHTTCVPSPLPRRPAASRVDWHGFCTLPPTNPPRRHRMRGWWLPLLVVLAACSNDSGTGPGEAPDTPATLTSTTLDGAIALVWSDNAYTSDPANFQNYRIYSTSQQSGRRPLRTSRTLEGTTVAPEFLVGALANGVPRCFHVTAVSIDGFESNRSPLRADTPRPDARNVVLFALQAQTQGSGFRFWDDLNDDGAVQSQELGLVRDGPRTDRLLRGSRRRRRPVPHAGPGRHRGRILRRERPGSRSHRHRLRREPGLPDVGNPRHSRLWLCLRDGRRRRVPALRRARVPVGRSSHRGLAFQTDPGNPGWSWSGAGDSR
jgi:hypothetical protein